MAEKVLIVKYGEIAMRGNNKYIFINRLISAIRKNLDPYGNYYVVRDPGRLIVENRDGELDYDFLICGYYDFNEQSKRVQTKCGFKPYRSLVMTTQMETKEQGTLMLLMNPKKNIKLVFSHRETLIFE